MINDKKLETFEEYSTPSGIKYKELETKIDNFISQYINKTISGAQISITKNDKIIFSKGYGLANREKNIITDKYTSFNYCSISKLFIWVSAMQLFEQNKLDLNKDIKKYLPQNYPLHLKYKKPITFLNLMNHNAGFESFWKYYDGTGSSSDFNSLEESIHRGYSGIQCFEPNKIQGYSNYGASLASLIIEQISGTEFYKYVDQNIFQICKMKCCYPERKPNSEIMKNKAVGYMLINNNFKITPVYRSDWLYPTGSVVGTCEDLSKFAIALMPNKGEASPLFQKKETLDELLKISYTSTGEELFSIHHGFWGTDGNFRGLCHTGCVDGMVANFLIFPQEKFSIAVLVNDDNGWDISLGVPSLLTGTDYDEDTSLPLPDTKIFEGNYVHPRTQIENRKKYFDIIKIKSINKSNIEIRNKNETNIYKQIRPYLFENITTKNGYKLKCKIYFKVEDGRVIKAVIAKNDIIPISEVKEYRNFLNFFYFKKFWKRLKQIKSIK